jgi:hypothetical protein
MYRAIRFSGNPIVHAGLDRKIGTSINGPSLIRVPDWVPMPLGDTTCTSLIYEEEGRPYLVGTGAGESNICGAELIEGNVSRAGGAADA